MIKILIISGFHLFSSLNITGVSTSDFIPTLNQNSNSKICDCFYISDIEPIDPVGYLKLDQEFSSITKKKALALRIYIQANGFNYHSQYSVKLKTAGFHLPKRYVFLEIKCLLI